MGIQTHSKYLIRFKSTEKLAASVLLGYEIRRFRAPIFSNDRCNRSIPNSVLVSLLHG